MRAPPTTVAILALAVVASALIGLSESPATTGTPSGTTSAGSGAFPTSSAVDNTPGLFTSSITQAATPTPPPASIPSDATPPLAPFQGHGSIDEAYELGARPGTELALVQGAHHRVVSTGVADAYGSLIVHNVTPGSGYRFETAGGDARAPATNSFSVPSTSETPPSSFFTSQHMQAGLNYITMRDGIQLAATVRLPEGKTMADGPFPTVIEYSGYDVAGPDDLITSEVSSNPKAMKDPLLPSTSTVVGSVVAPLLGFAVVSLQMRGTGCSGGAFDLFGYDSDYDGYDAVQIAGSQPWVAHHKVGLVGISYSGLSQFFIAGTRPPDLAAIAPMSPTNDLYATGYPGGIYNNGFAASWIAERVSDAMAAPEGGQPWADAEIEDGGTSGEQCLANQDLRLETQNVATLVPPNSARIPSLFDQRSPAMWAKNIDVPVFMVGALQDEQTGPQWPALITALSGDKNVWVTMINGAHIDSLGPASLSRWVEFLDIFVAQEKPNVPSFLGLAGSKFLTLFASKIFTTVADAPAETMPALRFTDAPSVAAARTEFFAQDPRVRVLMDNGNGAAGVGAMQPTWEADLASWPPPQAVVTTLDLGAGGGLGSTAPAENTVSFLPNPTARPTTSLPATGNAWLALPDYDWTPVEWTEGIGFITPTLQQNMLVIGPASLNLRLSSTATDTDLQVTVSEVLPNGQEMYVTSGFLRVGYRALDAARSTALNPVPTYLHLQTLTPGAMVSVRIPIDPIAFDFRVGSRLRITISAPGGDRPVWTFATPPTDTTVKDTVQLGGSGGSTLVLPVVNGITPGDAQPPCPSLRGEPCRTYVPAGNGG